MFEDRTRQILTCAVIIAILYLLYLDCNEGMSATRERANKIYNWFADNEDPQYVDYRDDLNGNNVEYYDMKNLKTAGQLTVDNVEKNIVGL